MLGRTISPNWKPCYAARTRASSDRWARLALAGWHPVDCRTPAPRRNDSQRIRWIPPSLLEFSEPWSRRIRWWRSPSCPLAESRLYCHGSSDRIQCIHAGHHYRLV